MGTFSNVVHVIALDDFYGEGMFSWN